MEKETWKFNFFNVRILHENKWTIWSVYKLLLFFRFAPAVDRRTVGAATRVSALVFIKLQLLSSFLLLLLLLLPISCYYIHENTYGRMHHTCKATPAKWMGPKSRRRSSVINCFFPLLCVMSLPLRKRRNSQKNRRLTLLARCPTSATTFIIFLFLRRRTRWPAGRALFLELIDQSGEGDVAFVHKPGWTVPSSFFNDIKAAADKKITRYLATTKELAAVYKVLKTNTAAASISGDIRI